MSFLAPGLLLLLLVLPFILLGAILAFRNQGQVWQKMIAPRLREQLVKTTPRTRRWVSLALGLLGCALMTIAFARPHKGESTTTEQISTRNILIAIDTSRSMRVKDGTPDRIASARALAIEVLTAFPNDRVGIIAFSSTSVLMAPLTIDHGAVQDTIAQLDTHILPSGGSDLPSAVTKALETFKKTGQKSNALIIISDGEDHSAAIDRAAEEIRDSRTIVCAIGVGSKTGSIIPDSNYRDGKFRDNQGQTVLSKMNPEALYTLALAGRGEFTEASSGSTIAIRSALASLERDTQEGRQTIVPNEYYQWFLAPAILLLALSIVVHSEFMLGGRRQKKKKITQPPAIKAPLTLLLLTLTLTPSADSATTLEQAEASYTSGNYQEALDLFTKALPESKGETRHTIHFSIGSTAFKLKQWAESNRHLSSALLTKDTKLQTQTHYNLGNSLFMTSWSQFKPAQDTTQQPSSDGKQSYQVESLPSAITALEDSISHYQASLTLDPEHKSATHNLDEAKKLLQQLKQEQKQQEQQEQQQGENKDKGDDKGETPDKGDPKQQDKGQGEKPGDQQNQNGQPKQDPNAKPKNGQGDQEQNDQKPPENQQGENPNSDQNDLANNPQPRNSERQQGETKESYAARVLKENSDAETRPVQRRLLRLRRPNKDW